MVIQSSRSRRAYRAALRENMESPLNFSEHFTGLFLGGFFSVTHHAGHEWNRRITDQKNTAMGYIRATPEGCEVRFFCTKGLLHPGLLLIYVLLSASMCLGVYLQSGFLSPKEAVTFLLLALGITLAMGFGSALAELMTEESYTGKRSLLSLLADPENPYSNLDKF